MASQCYEQMNEQDLSHTYKVQSDSTMPEILGPIHIGKTLVQKESDQTCKKMLVDIGMQVQSEVSYITMILVMNVDQIFARYNMVRYVV